MFWLRPFAHIGRKKGGVCGSVGGGMCWLRPFAHIWRDTWAGGRRGFIAVWVEGCADSTPLTIYGEIRGGWGGGQRGFHAAFIT